MKILCTTLVLVAFAAPALAGPHFALSSRRQQMLPVNPYGTDVPGVTRSRVAPSTAPSENHTIYVVPAPSGSHTGGVND
jgi:hypothetical protein